MNMFNFFHSVFAKVSGLLVGAGMAMGLVSAPAPEMPLVPIEPPAQTVTQEVPFITQPLSETEQLKKDTEVAKKEAESGRLKSTKTSTEAGRLKAESDGARATAELQRYQAENDKLKSDASARATIELQRLQAENDKLKADVAAARTTATSTVEQGKNYHADMAIRLRTQIALNESFITWLQAIGDEFSEFSQIHTDYRNRCSKLYYEERDAVIKIADSQVGVISSKMADTRENIFTSKSVLDTLNQNETLYIDEATYNKLKTTEAVIGDIEEAKNLLGKTTTDQLKSPNQIGCHGG